MISPYLMSRRQLLRLAGATGAAMLLPSCAHHLPLDKGTVPDFGDASRPFLGLATSLREEHDYEAVVEGELPAGLRGTLYRNGPGLFDRGGLRKRHLIDGDGMLQAFRFHDTGVRYRNRFVRTHKFLEEQSAGRFTRPTWSTQAPGGWPANFLRAGDIISQAGISAVYRNGLLYAFDESSLPYVLDPDTLETKGESTFGLPRDLSIYSGHPKLDPHTGEWLHFGTLHGPSPAIHLTTFKPDGSLREHRSLPMPRYVYMHDWFATSRHFIIALQPMEIKVWGFLLGFRSLAESLRWNAEEGTLLMILDRHLPGEPLLLETEAWYMWHSINAVSAGGEIVADFVGYREPDHLVGRDPYVSAVMDGRKGAYRWPGEVRRYRIDLTKRRVTQEAIHGGRCEWPRINDRLLFTPCRYVYLTNSRPDEFFWSAVSRLDLYEGKEERFQFPPGVYCCEPNFVEVPGTKNDPGSRSAPGWVLSEIYDSGTRKSSLAIFDAESIERGPVALVRLTHHVPFSYHGWWRAKTSEVSES